MNTSDQKLVELLARLMHEYAYLLDTHYENGDMADFADIDTTFLAFRAGLYTLREHDALVTNLVSHVENRMMEAYWETYEEILGAVRPEALPRLYQDEGQDEID
jgi:hypothetical protein